MVAETAAPPKLTPACDPAHTPRSVPCCIRNGEEAPRTLQTPVKLGGSGGKAATPSEHVQENSCRQPGGDRGEGDTRLPRAGNSLGCRVLGCGSGGTACSQGG